MDKENCVFWSTNDTIFGCSRAKLSSLLIEISRRSHRSNSTINPRLIMGANLTKEERFVWFVVCPQSFSGLVMSGLFYGWGALNGQLKNCCAFDNCQACMKFALIYKCLLHMMRFIRNLYLVSYEACGTLHCQRMDNSQVFSKTFQFG